MKLTELLLLNDNYTDPVTKIGTTDKEIRHQYCSLFYDEYLLPYKDKEISLFEIGIAGGGSLKLWSDYFQKGKIHGVDLFPFEGLDTLSRYPRVTTSFTDAYSSDFVNSLPNFDIIMDDGPHTIESQMSFFDLYLPKLNPGGILILEDIRGIDRAHLLIEKIKDRNFIFQDTSEITGLIDNIIIAIYN